MIIDSLTEENLALKAEFEKSPPIMPPVVIKVENATLGELLIAIWNKIKGI